MLNFKITFKVLQNSLKMVCVKNIFSCTGQMHLSKKFVSIFIQLFSIRSACRSCSSRVPTTTIRICVSLKRDEKSSRFFLPGHMTCDWQPYSRMGRLGLEDYSPKQSTGLTHENMVDCGNIRGSFFGRGSILWH